MWARHGARGTVRGAVRRLSTLAPVAERGAAAPVQLREDGLASLTKTLPIHKRDEAPMEIREGASTIEVRQPPRPGERAWLGAGSRGKRALPRSAFRCARGPVGMRTVGGERRNLRVSDG